MSTVLPHNQLLLDYIKLHQPVGSAALFAGYDGAGESAAAFSKRLHYLKAQGWLITTGRSTRAVWRLSDEPRPMHTVPRRPLPPPAPEPAQRVPPPRINIMQGSYQPAAEPVLRAGSQDHTRLPSLRNGRRVPFTSSYIPL
jgi:hypothetical protein